MSKNKHIPIRVAIEALEMRREFLIKSHFEGKRFATHWRSGKEQEALDFAISLMKQLHDLRHRKMADGVYTLSTNELIDEFLETSQ